MPKTRFQQKLINNKMQEESVYNLYQATFTDQNFENNIQLQQKSLKDTKINLLKQPNFIPPQKGKTVAEFYHLNSKKVLSSNFTTPKRGHATFGLPKKAYQIQFNDENKIVPTQKVDNAFSTPFQNEGTINLKTYTLPPIPKIYEGPILGIKSHVNFIQSNRQKASSLKPKVKLSETDFLSKKNYGQTPVYLDRVKNTITQEKDYIAMINLARNPTKPAKIQLGKNEVEEIKAALKRKYDEVNREYQSITHISKVISQGVKRKKENCEKELKIIERDMLMMDKEVIFVDASN